MMATRFQINVECGSLGFCARAFESDNLCVVFAGNPMKTGSDNFSTACQHGANQRIRTRPARGFESQTTSQAQVTFVQDSRRLVGQSAIPFYVELSLSPARLCAL